MPEFRMPSLGADMDEGTLLEWLVKPGDHVRRGDVIAVVDTDKAAIEVECFDDGVLERLLVPAGQRVAVGTALAEIGSGTVEQPVAVTAPPHPRVISPLVRHLADERGVDVGAVAADTMGPVLHRADIERLTPQRFPAPPAPAAVLVAAPALPSGVRASPYARRLAAAAGLDLSAVVGSGAGGAIRAEDVRHALPSPAVHAVTPQVDRERPVLAAPPTKDERADLMRRSIAALMTRSNREIPHYYLTTTIDLANSVAWLRSRNRDLPVAERLVPAALLIAAVARAAVTVGQLNGTWQDDSFHPASTVDIGLVVSLRRGGIIVPVITDAAGRPVEQIMRVMRELVERARTGRLRSSELTAPSITISNLGDQGVESVLGVVYPPQVALVGFGAVVERPWAVDGMLAVHPVVTASLAADHRASDGAIGARFLNHVDRLLQKPEEL